MKRIEAIIEKGSDGLFAVRTDSKIGKSYPGGFGSSVEEAKEDFQESVAESISESAAAGLKVPDIDSINVVYSYDIPSFFNFFDFINVSRFASMAGINESKMRQYKAGLAYPSEKTTRKIAATISHICTELSRAVI